MSWRISKSCACSTPPCWRRLRSSNSPLACPSAMTLGCTAPIIQTRSAVCSNVSCTWSLWTILRTTITLSPANFAPSSTATPGSWFALTISPMEPTPKPRKPSRGSQSRPFSMLMTSWTRRCERISSHTLSSSPRARPSPWMVTRSIGRNGASALDLITEREWFSTT